MEKKIIAKIGKILKNVFYFIAGILFFAWLSVQILDIISLLNHDIQTTLISFGLEKTGGTLSVTYPQNVPYSQEVGISPFIVLDYSNPDGNNIEVQLSTWQKFQIAVHPGTEKNWSNWLQITLENGKPVTVFLKFPQYTHLGANTYTLRIGRGNVPITFNVQGYGQELLSKLVQICKDFGFPASVLFAVAGWVFTATEKQKKLDRDEKEKRLIERKKYFKRRLDGLDELYQSDPLRHLKIILDLHDELEQWREESEGDVGKEYWFYFETWFGASNLFENLARALSNCERPEEYLYRIYNKHRFDDGFKKKLAIFIFSEDKLLEGKKVAQYLKIISDDPSPFAYELLDLYIIYLQAAWRFNPDETITLLSEKQEIIKKKYVELFLDRRLFVLRQVLQTKLGLEMNIPDSTVQGLYWEYQMPWSGYGNSGQGEK